MSTEPEQGGAEPESTADTPRERGRLRITDPMVLVALLLAGAAVVAAAFFGIRWAVDSHNGDLAFSKARDDALRAGEQAIKNFNTMDYHNVQGSLDVWKQSSTGGLYNEVVGYTKDNNFISTFQKAKVVTTARILDAAVTDLNTHDGTATVIAAVDVTVTPDGQKPTDKRTRIEGNLTRTGNGWLMNAVQPVPVPSTGQ